MNPRISNPLKLLLCVVAPALILASCTSAPAPSARAGGQGTAGRPVINIASFDFPESEILASVYARALGAKGYPVRVLANVGARELLEPALARGLVDFLPEYAGSALAFLSLGQGRSTSDPAETHQALAAALEPLGAVALDPAPAQDANAIVVTQQTADRYGLQSDQDLARVAGQLTFGGPPECPERSFCLQGLRNVYGTTFREFIPLDVGGPLTLQALEAGEIDVALLFTTDPSISLKHLVVLADDRGLQPAENITPVMRRSVVTAYGQALLDAVNAVSLRLTTDELRAMNERVGVDGQMAATVAAAWLEAHGLSR
jgi:osmoprotectant transport system substrate-binding protein